MSNSRHRLVASILSLAVASSLGLADVRRVPAEWERHAGTWLQWPPPWESSYRPDFARILGVLQAYEPVHLLVFGATAQAQAEQFLDSQGVPLDNITFHIADYDWSWMRDNGPVWIESDGVLELQDWGFDGWGGEAEFWEYDDGVPCRVASITNVACEFHALINERGTLEFNGVDTLITSFAVLGHRNPGWTRPQMDAYLRSAFGVDHVHWLTASSPGDLTRGHVDGIARFIDHDTVVVGRFVDQADPDAPVYEDAAQILSDAGLEVLRMDIPGSVTYRGSPMAAIYLNWLVANDVVIVNGFAHPQWDAAARAQVQQYFPDRDVHVVDTRELWYSGGGVHCVTNDQPQRTLRLAVEAGRLSWTDSFVTTPAHDVVRGDLGSLRTSGGDFTISVSECVGDDLSADGLVWMDDPQPGVGSWFLVRPVTAAGAGSFDSGGDGQIGSRDAGIEAAAPTCP